MSASYTPSRLGAVNNDTGTTAKDTALFLKLFGGEVLKSFSNAAKVLGTGVAMRKSLTYGKSA